MESTGKIDDKVRIFILRRCTVTKDSQGKSSLKLLQTCQACVPISI